MTLVTDESRHMLQDRYLDAHRRDCLTSKLFGIDCRVLSTFFDRGLAIQLCQEPKNTAFTLKEAYLFLDKIPRMRYHG